jgi:enoyl-CoA hydratase/carnithine racemase
MAFVETEIHDQIMVIRLNRPDRLNALSTVVREGMAEAFTEFRDSDFLEVAILTGTGRGFCAGEDMKESLERGEPGSSRQKIENPFNDRTLQKPVIAAINGYAMGGGFMLVERTDLRVAVKGAVFEMSEAKRWLLGGYNHGFVAGLPHPIATEMALGFRFTAERLYEVGFLNRLVDPDDLMPTAMEMAEHLLTLPPAARVNTVYMMRQMIPQVAPPFERLATALHEHGCKEDRMESRRAFGEKRKPQFRGWDDPEDRHRMPTLESVSKAE